MYQTIFIRSLPFFSRNLLNVERDWNKVGSFGKHLGVIDDAFSVNSCYTNEMLPKMPYSDLEPIACCVSE